MQGALNLRVSKRLTTYENKPEKTISFILVHAMPYRNQIPVLSGLIDANAMDEIKVRAIKIRQKPSL